MKGLAQIPLLIFLVLMAVALPVTNKLVRENQDMRNMAAPISVTGITCTTDAACLQTGGKCVNGMCSVLTVTPALQNCQCIDGFYQSGNCPSGLIGRPCIIAGSTTGKCKSSEYGSQGSCPTGSLCTGTYTENINRTSRYCIAAGEAGCGNFGIGAKKCMSNNNIAYEVCMGGNKWQAIACTGSKICQGMGQCEEPNACKKDGCSQAGLTRSCGTKGLQICSRNIIDGCLGWGTCVEKFCKPNSKRCINGGVDVCNAEGTHWLAQSKCDVSCKEYNKDVFCSLGAGQSCSSSSQCNSSCCTKNTTTNKYTCGSGCGVISHRIFNSSMTLEGMNSLLGQKCDSRLLIVFEGDVRENAYSTKQTCTLTCDSKSGVVVIKQCSSLPPTPQYDLMCRNDQVIMRGVSAVLATCGYKQVCTRLGCTQVPQCQDGHCMVSENSSCSDNGQIAPNSSVSGAYLQCKNGKWQSFYNDIKINWSNCPNNYKDKFLKNIANNQDYLKLNQKSLDINCEYANTEFSGLMTGFGSNVTGLDFACGDPTLSSWCTHVTVHEFAHAYAASNFNAHANNPEFDRATGCVDPKGSGQKLSFKIQESPVSDYAKTNCAEAWAEAVARYNNPSCTMKTQYPVQYELVKNTLYGGKEFCDTAKYSCDKLPEGECNQQVTGCVWFSCNNKCKDALTGKCDATPTPIVVCPTDNNATCPKPCINFACATGVKCQKPGTTMEQVPGCGPVVCPTDNNATCPKPCINFACATGVKCQKPGTTMEQVPGCGPTPTPSPVFCPTDNNASCNSPCIRFACATGVKCQKPGTTMEQVPGCFEPTPLPQGKMCTPVPSSNCVFGKVRCNGTAVESCEKNVCKESSGASYNYFTWMTISNCAGANPPQKCICGDNCAGLPANKICAP